MRPRTPPELRQQQPSPGLLYLEWEFGVIQREMVGRTLWCLFFAMIGGWRMARGKLSADLAIVAVCIFGMGLVVYVATCICNLSQPRYVLPFWVGTVASGCLLIAGRGIDFRSAEEQGAAH